MEPTKRQTLTQLFDTARVDGVSYLLLIVSLRSTTVKEIRSITGASEPTVNGILNHLESRRLVQRSASGKADHWLPAPAVALAFHQKIFGAPSSSSDLDLIESSDLIRSDPEEEERNAKILGDPLEALAPVAADQLALPQPRDAETAAEYRLKVYLTDRHYHLTGDKRTIYVEDDGIYAIHFEAWLHQVGDMQQRGVKIKHPAAYALSCCQKRHPADPKYVDLAARSLDLKLRYFDPDAETMSADMEVTA